MIKETESAQQKKSRVAREGRIQAECFAWFWNTFPQYRKLLFHVPNENDRCDGNAIQGAIRKSLGIVPGVSDLILLIPRGGYGAFLIEMKDEHGTQKPAQKEWQSIVEAQGYKYIICRSLEQFQIEIYNYLSIKH